MQLLKRWSLTLSLVSTCWLGQGLISNHSAYALPEPQIIEKLKTVPVFAITDSQGAPLMGAEANAPKDSRPFVNIFIAQRDAQDFIQKFQKDQPNQAKGLQIRTVALSDIYKLQVDGFNKPQNPVFRFIPNQVEVNSALSLVREKDQKVKEFLGVPIFVATVKNNDGKETFMLASGKDSQPVVPIFFSKDELNQELTKFIAANKTTDPAIASKIKIQPLMLENFLNYMRTSNDPLLNNILFAPTQK